VERRGRGSSVRLARVLAPLAFFTAVTILVLLVHSALNDSSPRATTTPSTVADGSSRTTQKTEAAAAKRKKRFYRVHSGDTLDSIAGKFETTVDDLLRLNPKIDPLSLSPGDRIRVR
jgi:LysM repeat protein